MIKYMQLTTTNMATHSFMLALINFIASLLFSLDPAQPTSRLVFVGVFFLVISLVFGSLL